MKSKHMNRATLISTPQLHIETCVMPEFDNKLWVRAWPRYNYCSKCQQWGGFKPWVVSFQDLYHILREIADCEDIKYPSDNGFQGRDMVVKFVQDSLWTAASYEELRMKYKIPDRGNNNYG